jgi:hypothetical protein
MIIARLEQKYGSDVAMRALFDAGTIAAVARLIAE